jgi:hypothetical protein
MTRATLPAKDNAARRDYFPHPFAGGIPDATPTSSRSGHSDPGAKGRGTNVGDRTELDQSTRAMTPEPDYTGAPEAIEPPDYIDLGTDSGLDAYVPDTFADDAAAGINATLARHFTRRRDSSPRHARRGHDGVARTGSASDRPLLDDASRSLRHPRPNTNHVNRPRGLDYRKPALPLSFALIILAVSFIIFLFLTFDHFAPKHHDGRARQHTTTAAQNQ